MLKCVTGVLLVLGACSSARAGVIASVTDSSFLGFGPAIFGQYPSPNQASGGQVVAISFTLSSGYSLVSISVPLQLWLATNGSYSGKAYLTNTIGPAALSAIAETAFTRTNVSPEPVELFRNLALSAGTYYLTLSGSDPAVGAQPGFIWSTAVTTNPTFREVAAPGVTIGSPLVACNFGGACGGVNYLFPPGSTFNAQVESANTFQQFAVTEAPEPATVSLLALGLLAGLWARRRSA